MNGWLTIKTRILTGPLKTGLNDIMKSFKNGTRETLAMVKAFGKLALIIGTIAGVFKLIQGGMQSLLARNEELNNKIQTIKLALSNLAQGLFNAMGNLLEPLITKLVDGFFKILSYLNVITKEFFGLDLFAKRTDKSLKSSSKSAKEIKKSLAGFDEANVLSESSSSGGGGGSIGGATTLKPIEVSIKFVEAVKEYKKMWNEILDINEKEATKLLKNSDKLWGTLKAGVFQLEQGMVKIFTGFANVDLKMIGSGILEVVKGLINTALGTIKGLFSSIIELGRKFGETIRNVFAKIGEKIKEVWDSAKTKTTNIFNSIKSTITNVIDKIKSSFTSLKTSISNVWDGIKTSLKAPLNVMIGWINKVIDGLNKISIKVPDWVPEYGGKKWGFNIGKIPKLAQGGIVNNPGMGVNMGSYIAGERGAEAVLPLTDDTLQRLANMIPININLTNEMNGRVLNRELMKIQNQNKFATNR